MSLRNKLRKLKKGVGVVGRVAGRAITSKAGSLAIKGAATALLGGGGGAALTIGSSLLGGSKKKTPSAPALPSYAGGGGFSAGLPAVTSPSTGPGGFWWRGPGGKLQMPWSDPSVHDALKPFSLDDSALKIYYRAPMGYVVVRDEKGRPYPLRKDVAIRIGWWHPAAKPPMSATEWKSLKRANHVVKRLKTMNRMAMRVANYDPRRKVKALPPPKKGR